MGPALYFRAFRKIPNLLCACHFCEENKETILRTDVDGKEKVTKSPKVIAKSILKEFPEEPTTCCMSGCANCVWIDYADRLSEYLRDGGKTALDVIEKNITDPHLKAFVLQELRMRKNSK